MVVWGAPGTGKSELAFEYARLNWEKYPGGTYWVRFPAHVEVDLAEVTQRLFPEIAASSLQDLARMALALYGEGQMLFIYDGVVRPRDLEDWMLPPHGMELHLLITSNSHQWTLPAFQLLPLDDQDALDLVEQLVGRPVVERLGTELLRESGGLPVQLLPRSLAAARELSRHPQPRWSSAPSQEATASYRKVWDLLSEDETAALAALALFADTGAERAQLDELLLSVDWSITRTSAALDGCAELLLIEERDGYLRAHGLLLAFVRGLVVVLPDPLHRTYWDASLVAARAVLETPAFPHAARRFLSHRVHPDLARTREQEQCLAAYMLLGRSFYELGNFREALLWFLRGIETAEKGDGAGRTDSDSLGRSLHLVGLCHSQLGRKEEALAWYLRAVEVKARGDVDGRVDTERLGASLHQVGYCHSQLGRFEEALGWFLRAVEASEKGDLHGRINSESLGISLDRVGHCHSQLGRFEEALPWLVRAVAAKEKGDVHGRVSHESLGTSLHQIGHCHSELGRLKEALPWFLRAVEAKEKGDVHGRVNGESLGISLDRVGDCHSELGRLEEALPWFLGAVAAKEKGDVYGRINSESLGWSIGALASCNRLLERRAQAEGPTRLEA